MNNEEKSIAVFLDLMFELYVEINKNNYKEVIKFQKEYPEAFIDILYFIVEKDPQVTSSQAADDITILIKWIKHSYKLFSHYYTSSHY